MLLDLFLTFAKIGAFTFGGGYAMLAIIEEECVEKRKWITSEELATVTVIAESTPGPIVINCATYTGYKCGGVLGALASTIGVTLPSFVIIYLISLFFDNFLEITVVANAFKGIKIAVGILIARAAINLWRKKKEKDLVSYVILILAFMAMFLIEIFAINISTVVLIFTAGLISVLVYLVKKRSKKGGAVS